jgi:hypothetical protein
MGQQPWYSHTVGIYASTCSQGQTSTNEKISLATNLRTLLLRMFLDFRVEALVPIMSATT